jgi:uncharacterized YigZ family protein
MLFVDSRYSETIEEKQSKFIAHLVPYDLYEQTLNELKTSHPKARHFVTAYRYINEFKQIVESSSDDGEPKGTSGKPTLMVLQGLNLINSAIITVRYFGGTKLGTGGLVRAYSDAANLVLQSANLLEYKDEKTIQIAFEYTYLRKIEYEIQKHQLKILEKSFHQNTLYTIKGDEENLHLFLEEVQRIIELL